MTKKPVLNALAASIYISLIATGMMYGEQIFNGPDSVLAPIAMISLFTLSAAVMGYIFLGQPIQLYLDGNKKQAVRLFVQTLIIFGCITALAFFALYLTSSTTK